MKKGDKVQFDSQSKEGIVTGWIVRVNKKTVSVTERKLVNGRGVQWRVPHKMIRALETI
jgi:hypothetical protein